jgi:hypothetical protein
MTADKDTDISVHSSQKKWEITAVFLAKMG